MINLNVVSWCQKNRSIAKHLLQIALINKPNKEVFQFDLNKLLMGIRKPQR
jgi:hypothetical protein